MPLLSNFQKNEKESHIMAYKGLSEYQIGFPLFKVSEP